MVDRLLSDALSLVTSLKALDSAMKTSLRSMQLAEKQPTGRITTVTGAEKPGQKGGREVDRKPQAIVRNSKVRLGER